MSVAQSTPTDDNLSPHCRRQRQVRRQRIIAKAMDVLIHRGFDGLSMNRLARELGYTPGALYLYFASRDALLAELRTVVFRDAHRFYARYADQVKSFAADSDLSPALRLLLRVYMTPWVFHAFAHDYPQQWGFLVQALSDPTQMREDDESAVTMAAGQSVLAAVAALIEEAAAANGLAAGDSYRRAIVFWSGLLGLLQMEKVSRWDPRFCLPPLLEEHAVSLLGGWGAEPNALEQVLAVARHWRDGPSKAKTKTRRIAPEGRR